MAIHIIGRARIRPCWPVLPHRIVLLNRLFHADGFDSKVNFFLLGNIKIHYNNVMSPMSGWKKCIIWRWLKIFASRLSSVMSQIIFQMLEVICLRTLFCHFIVTSVLEIFGFCIWYFGILLWVGERRKSRKCRGQNRKGISYRTANLKKATRHWILKQSLDKSTVWGQRLMVILLSSLLKNKALLNYCLASWVMQETNYVSQKEVNHSHLGRFERPFKAIAHGPSRKLLRSKKKKSEHWSHDSVWYFERTESCLSNLGRKVCFTKGMLYALLILSA